MLPIATLQYILLFFIRFILWAKIQSRFREGCLLTGLSLRDFSFLVLLLLFSTKCWTSASSLTKVVSITQAQAMGIVAFLIWTSLVFSKSSVLYPSVITVFNCLH